MTTRLKYLITSIDGDTSKGAIRSFVDTECLALDSRALRAEIERLQPDVDMSFVYTCSNCGYEDVDMEIPLTAGFFGLRPENKPEIHEQIFSLIQFSSGGFTFSDVYTMPVWLRKFYVKKLIETKQKEADEYKKQQGKQVARPNIGRKS